MRRRRLVTGVVCAMGALALGACATPGYNPSRIQSELVRAGATPKQAKCVTEGLSGKFDEGQLGSHSPPNAITAPTASSAPVSTTAPPSSVKASTTTTEPNEYVTTREILKGCGVNLPLYPLSSLP